MDSAPQTYRITILGCRVNHAEARQMEILLRARGLTEIPDATAPDLTIIHACSITSTAAAKTRQAARRAARAGGSVILTGCLEHPEGMDEIGPVVPQHAPDGTPMLQRLAGVLDQLCPRSSADSTTPDPTPPNAVLPLPGVIALPGVMPIADEGRHIRAELHIQDGCDARCTFCIVPSLRPTLRSKRVADAVAEATRLVELGHREIVLTGIFLGAYGHETALRRKQSLPEAEHLADLLDAVAQVPGLARLRISSLEPGDVTSVLLEAMVANQPIVVPHLHLPLQSGSDRILRAMNRQYTVGAYLDMIDQVNEALSQPSHASPSGGPISTFRRFDVSTFPPAITTDIICGFPGETDDDFQHTLDVVNRVGYLHMHVFPYSPRKGTAAARWKDKFIPPGSAQQRVRTLIDLENDPDAGLSVSYRRHFRGRTVRVILEQPDKADPSYMTGRCDHYALIHIKADLPRGEVITVQISDVTSDRTIGDPATIRRADQALPLLGS